MCRRTACSVAARRWTQAAALMVLMHHSWAYPSLYVARDQAQCTDHPTTAFGKVHDYTSNPDKTVSFAVTSASTGKPAANAKGETHICGGDSYNVLVQFGAPALRNYLFTSSHGSFAVANNDCDAWCPNRICSPAPATQSKSVFSLPCDTPAGTQVQFKVTSANGRIPTPGSTLRSATLTLLVDGPCLGKCPAAATAAEKGGQKKVAAARNAGKPLPHNASGA